MKTQLSRPSTRLAGLIMLAVAASGTAALGSLPTRGAAPEAPPVGLPQPSSFPVQREDYGRLATQTHVTLTNVVVAENRNLTLELEPFEVLTQDAILVLATPQGETPIPAPAVRFFHGRVQGEEHSSVYLAVSPGAVEGWIAIGADTYMIASGPPDQNLPTLVYNPRTLAIGGASGARFRCEAVETAESQKPLPPLPPGELDSPPARCLRIALDTDHNFLDGFGGNVQHALVYACNLLAASSEIYSRDLNVQLEACYIRLWFGSDPWTGQSTAAELPEFQSYWNTNMGYVSRATAHLLTPRSLGGGIAYLSALFNGSAYGVDANLSLSFPYPLRDYDSNNWDIDVLTHEMGHNFGTRHTHCYSPPIDMCYNLESGCYSGNVVCSLGTIMSYCHACGAGMSNIQLAFHGRCVNEQMLPYLATVTHDMTCPYGDVWVDFYYPGTGNGTFPRPYNNLAAAFGALPPGGTIRFFSSNAGPTVLTINTPMTLAGYDGPVIIGQ